MARVHSVEKSYKAQGTCRACGKEIEKGVAYKWFQLYHAGKSKYHASCRIPASHTTGSDKLGRVYDARDAASEAVASWEATAFDTDVSGLQSILDECADAAQEVADEYRESADRIHENFSESSTADDCEQRADDLESWVSDLQDPSFEDFEFDESDVEFEPNATDDAKKEKIENARREKFEEWADEQRQKASEAIDNCPL